MILVNFFCFSALLATFLTFASAAPRDTIAAHLGALLPRQAPPPVGAGNFRNCGGGLDLIVKNALRDAQTLSQAAVNYSPTDPVSLQRLAPSEMLEAVCISDFSSTLQPGSVHRVRKRSIR